MKASPGSRTPLSFTSRYGSPESSPPDGPGTAAISVATPSRGLCVPALSTQQGSPPVQFGPNGSVLQPLGENSTSLQKLVLVESHGITSLGGGSSARTV